MRKSVVLFAVVLMGMLSAGVARAESVLYTTWGTFTNPNAGFTISNAAAPGGTSTIHDGTLTGSTLTFTGVADLVDTPSDNPLGIFMSTTPLTKGEIDSYNGTTFTLTIDQLDPGEVIGTVTGTITGTLKKSTKGAGGSTLDLVWGGASVTLLGVTYAPADIDIAGATFTTPTTLQGHVSAVPVPASALGGAGLFGFLSLAKLLKRRAA